MVDIEVIVNLLLLSVLIPYVDDSDIVGMYPKDSAVPYGFILNVNKLINGKKYMCLNQNKENQEPDRLIHCRKEAGLVFPVTNNMNRSFSEINT